MAKVWRDGAGALFHDECFEEGESRDGHTAVKLEDLDEDSECASCGGEFLAGPADDDDDDDEDGC